MRDCAYYLTDHEWLVLSETKSTLAIIYNEYAPINGVTQPYGEAINHVINGRVISYAKGNDSPYEHKLFRVTAGIMATYQLTPYLRT